MKPTTGIGNTGEPNQEILRKRATEQKRQLAAEHASFVLPQLRTVRYTFKPILPV